MAALIPTAEQKIKSLGKSSIKKILGTVAVMRNYLYGSVNAKSAGVLGNEKYEKTKSR